MRATNAGTERDADLVRRDVAQGNLSDETARAAYPYAF